MATEEDRSAEENKATAELAPNMWFTEYGMPYTTLILEAEAAAAKENPELAGQPRNDLAQFIIDQETAVARDFHAGLISQDEFDAYKEKSQDLLDATTERLEGEVDELLEDVDDWADDFEVSVKDFAAEHEGEFTELVELAKTQEISAKDISLDLVADTLGVTVNGIDSLLERLPPHIHDLIDVVKEDSINNAQELLEARGELSSAEDHNLDRDAERLETIEPVLEANIDEAHESIDRDFEQVD